MTTDHNEVKQNNEGELIYIYYLINYYTIIQVAILAIFLISAVLFESTEAGLKKILCGAAYKACKCACKYKDECVATCKSVKAKCLGLGESEVKDDE